MTLKKKMMVAFTRQTAVGLMTLVEIEGALTEARFDSEYPCYALNTETPLLAQAFLELEQYFAGQRKSFSIPLCPTGTLFQLKCWKMLEEIPYGETRSYAAEAVAIGNPKAYRAVGAANHNNPIPIFIPCHRVVGKNGSLVGYAGGLPIKEKLLQLEKMSKG